jgi:hypothetical protein
MKKYVFILVVFSIASCQETDKRYYPNGNVMRECEIDEKGLCHGKFWEYRKDGTLISEVKCVNDKKEGKKIYYYPSGEISCISIYKNDILIDSIVEFYESGKVKAIAKITNGKVTGKCREFHENGIISAESNLINEKHFGEQFIFSKSGIVEMWAYHQDSLISFVLFDEKNPKIIQKEKRIITLETNLKDNKCALGETIKINFGLLGPVLESDKASLKNFYTIFEARQWKLCLEEGKISKNNRTYLNWKPDSAGFYEIRIYTEYKGKLYSEISKTIFVGNPKPFKDVPFVYPKDECKYFYDSNSDKIIKSENGIVPGKFKKY